MQKYPEGVQLSQGRVPNFSRGGAHRPLDPAMDISKFHLKNSKHKQNYSPLLLGPFLNHPVHWTQSYICRVYSILVMCIICYSPQIMLFCRFDDNNNNNNNNTNNISIQCTNTYLRTSKVFFPVYSA